MRALTLTQPWAGLVASGIKLVENRGRAMIKHEDFGKPFALHASRAIDDSVYQRIREIAPELYRGVQLSHEMPWWRLSRVTSAIIAVATIRTVIHVGGCTPQAIFEALVRAGAEDQFRFTFGPTVYILENNVRVLKEPVPCRGYQAFWRLAPELAALVEEQLR